MNPTDVKGLVDHAASQTDRWLFVALLVAVCIGAWFAVRWLASQYRQTLDQWRTDMIAMQKQITGLHEERVKAAEAFAAEMRSIHKDIEAQARETIRAYSEVLARNAEALGGVNFALRDLQQAFAIARLDPQPTAYPRREAHTGSAGPVHHSPV